MQAACFIKHWEMRTANYAGMKAVLNWRSICVGLIVYKVCFLLFFGIQVSGSERIRSVFKCKSAAV